MRSAIHQILVLWTCRYVQCRVGLVGRPTAAVEVPIVAVGTRGFERRCCPVQALTDTVSISKIPSGLLLFVTLQIFWRVSDYLNYFQCLAINRPTLIWLIILISQSSSANLKRSLCLFLVRSFLGRQPLETHFSPLMFIKESILCKNMCLNVTNDRRSDHWHSILNFQAPDSNVEHQTLSAKLFFFHIALCSES